MKRCLVCKKQLGFTAQHSKKRNIRYCWKHFKFDKKWQAGVKKTQFNKNKSSWNKGLHVQINNSLIKWRAEGNHSHRGKHLPSIQGDRHWNWKGGLTPKHAKIRHSLEYKIWREAVFARDDWACQSCSKRGGDLEADHIKPFFLYPELRFAIDNGRTLCKPCHKQTDTWGYKTRDFLRLEDGAEYVKMLKRG